MLTVMTVYLGTAEPLVLAVTDECHCETHCPPGEGLHGVLIAGNGGAVKIVSSLPMLKELFHVVGERLAAYNPESDVLSEDRAKELLGGLTDYFSVASDE